MTRRHGVMDWILSAGTEVELAGYIQTKQRCGCSPPTWNHAGLRSIFLRLVVHSTRGLSAGQRTVCSCNDTTRPESVSPGCQTVHQKIRQTAAPQNAARNTHPLRRHLCHLRIHAAIGNPRVMSVPSRSHSAHRVPSRHNATSAARASRVPRYLRPLTTPIVNGRVGAAREEVCPEIATHLKIRGIASVTAPLATQWGDGMPGVPSSSGAGEIMMQKGGGLGILEFLESLEFVR